RIKWPFFRPCRSLRTPRFSGSKRVCRGGHFCREQPLSAGERGALQASAGISAKWFHERKSAPSKLDRGQPSATARGGVKRSQRWARPVLPINWDGCGKQATVADRDRSACKDTASVELWRDTFPCARTLQNECVREPLYKITDSFRAGTVPA